MPVTAKTSSKLAKLGDISTFDVSSTAVPVDTSDSSGSVPSLNATFADGSNTAYLIGESVTVKAPVIGTFTGEVVSRNKAANSSRYSVSVNSIMARLNVDLRAYPLADFSASAENAYLPLYSLEYWTQQCGVFFTALPGDVLYYQSGFGHVGAFGKDITRPLRATRTLDSGGTNGSMILGEGRIWTGFGTGMETKVTFPTGTYLPFKVPLSADVDRLVFGADIHLLGTTRTGDITWNLAGASGARPSIRLAYDSEVGFLLQTATSSGGAFSTRLTATVAKGSKYTCYVSVARGTSTTLLRLIVVDSTGAIVYSQQSTPGISILGQMTLRSVRHYGSLTGSGTEPMYGNSFIAVMKGAPDRRYPDVKSLSYGTKGAKFMVGFSGNAWEYIKQYCSIYHLDVAFKDGKLTIGPRQRDLTVGAELSGLVSTIQNRDQARNVEVVNQNHTPTGITPTVMWAADSVYQVAVGEVQEFTVQTPHSILETSQPVCVSGINPYPYKTGAGQYVVTGSDGYIVSPTFWADQGGKITTSTTDNDGEIKITIKGPDYDSPRAPYRISEGDAGRPALYVTGLGILAKPKTLRVGTGKMRAAKEVGATIDSPFIGNAKLAYDAAVRAAQGFATPETTATFAEPIQSDGVSKLGASPAGALVKRDGNILRVVSASQNPSSVSGTANQHNTIYQLKRSFPSMTIKQQKDYYAGKTIGQVNIRPIRKVN